MPRPPYSRSSSFVSGIINIYQQGGFPAQVILAKEEFIKHYNPEGAYWKQADEASRLRLRPILEGHIVDLAKHYHALAQMDNNEGDYLKAATWYRTHLSLKPAEQDAIAINQLLAEALYSAKHYSEAIPEFEKTAYEYNNPKAADAAYFALLSYQDWDTSLGEDTAARQKLMTPLAMMTTPMPADDRPRLRLSTRNAPNKPNTAPDAPTAGVIQAPHIPAAS